MLRLQGSPVPYITLGEGSKSVILTARHHACESTGNYVLEGMLEELLRHPLPDTTVFCVPFVDYDGVIRGDQGKSREPHDHNRDSPFDGGFLAYHAKNDYPPDTDWNQYGPQFGCYMSERPENELAFTLETTYFGTPDNKVSEDRMLALGRCFARAVSAYRQTKETR